MSDYLGKKCDTCGTVTLAPESWFTIQDSSEQEIPWFSIVRTVDAIDGNVDHSIPRTDHCGSSCVTAKVGMLVNKIANRKNGTTNGTSA